MMGSTGTTTGSTGDHADKDTKCDDLLVGMATALSIDFWEPTKASKCEYEPDPSLAVNFICMHPDAGKATASAQSSSPDKSEAARFQEIYVDLVGMICAVRDAASRHVLDDRFDSFLGEGERAFKDSLLEFLQKQTEESKSTHAFTHLEEILRVKMGFKSTYYRANQTKMKRLSGSKEDNIGTHPGDAKKLQVCASPGHVFVCHASVCDIQCDAFLCPASISKKKKALGGTIFHQWKQKMLKSDSALRQVLAERKNRLPLEFASGYDRVVTFQHWPDETNLPLFIAGEVSLSDSRKFAQVEFSKDRQLPPEEGHIAALLETVRQFLKLATAVVQSRPPHTWRQRYLLALPVLGTGGAFAGDLTGQIVQRLLVCLNEFVVTQSRFDVVLVCADEATYAHAQVIRHEVYDAFHSPQHNVQHDQFPCFQLLSKKQRGTAFQLAELASQRHLSLFVGAGVSIGSGLPSWFGLLHYIEDRFTPTGDPLERTIGEANSWDPLKMAARLHDMCEQSNDRDGARVPLKQRVCAYLQRHGQHPGLLLSLLISLPCHSIVTQNYDQLIEQACQLWNIAGKKVGEGKESITKGNLSVIPYSPRRNASYWLLKMHGCVSAPGEIVLTQDDYNRYDNSPRSQALSGLVQASLLTKHLLFVGFSLSDPNYLRIIDQVRDALRPYSHS